MSKTVPTKNPGGKSSGPLIAPWVEPNNEDSFAAGEPVFASAFPSASKPATAISCLSLGSSSTPVPWPPVPDPSSDSSEPKPRTFIIKPPSGVLGWPSSS